MKSYHYSNSYAIIPQMSSKVTKKVQVEVGAIRRKNRPLVYAYASTQGVYFIIVLCVDYLEYKESAQVNSFQWTPCKYRLIIMRLS